jgi:hypothetical protein
MEVLMKSHTCRNGVTSFEASAWVSDRFGLPLFRTCSKCRGEKMSKVASHRQPGARVLSDAELEGPEHNYGISRR